MNYKGKTALVFKQVFLCQQSHRKWVFDLPKRALENGEAGLDCVEKMFVHSSLIFNGVHLFVVPPRLSDQRE